MKRLVRLFFAFIIAVSVSRNCALADLSGEIDRVVADKLLARADVGIQIVRLGNGSSDVEKIYQQNASEPLVPASNLKVITTSAALEKLGGDFQFRTLLVEHHNASGGEDLVVIGDGDPTLGDAELLKKLGWGVDTVFQAWAKGLKQRGIDHVRDLMVDDSVFDDQFLNPDWPADQTQKRYVAEIAGLNLNANCVDLYVRPAEYGQTVSYSMDPQTDFVSVKNSCVGGSENAVWLSREPGSNDLVLRGEAREANEVPISVTVHDPPMYAGTFLAEILKSNGVAISGSVKRDRSLRAAYLASISLHDPAWKLLAVHQTPLASVISRANKDSMNLYAECVCKRLGFAATGEGSWASGTAEVSSFLDSLHISPGEYHLDDGCGLSKQNAISARTMVSVLVHDYYGNNSKIWMNSLAIAGEDGTLADRFRGTDLRGRVIAKSGFVNGVSCLSGYLHGKDDRWYCFSIMFNGIPEGTNSGAKVLQERIVRALDREMGETAAAN